MCAPKHQSFANVILTRNTICDCILDHVADVEGQLKEKVSSFVTFLVAIDESTDIADICQLAIFIIRVDGSLTVTDEFVLLVPMTGMTNDKDTFRSLAGTLVSVGVDCAHTVSVATDGALSVTAKKVGVVLHTVNGGPGFSTFHCIIQEETLCCKSLKIDYVMEVVVKTVNSINARSLNHHQFDNVNEEGVSHDLPYHTEI